jgi:hypothetical protein
MDNRIISVKVNVFIQGNRYLDNYETKFGWFQFWDILPNLFDFTGSTGYQMCIVHIQIKPTEELNKILSKHKSEWMDAAYAKEELGLKSVVFKTKNIEYINNIPINVIRALDFMEEIKQKQLI